MEGLLPVDKPHGWTSHDLVDFARRRTGERRIGHAGTLDPMATGLVVLLIGRATKLSDEFLNHDKTYEALLTIGIETDTQDMEGKILSESTGDAPSEQAIHEAFACFTGECRQQAPRYSSVKVGGRRSYEMARKNVAFEQPFKTVQIKQLDIHTIHESNVWFKAHVSKGTYIRTLASDIGKKLGTHAALSALRRTASGPFRIEDARTVPKLKNASPAEIAAMLLPASAVQAPAA